MTSTSPVLIAGAGIGGLAAAIALAGKGIKSVVLERHADAREAGAGIQLGPNAVAALRWLGVADRLAAKAGLPQAIHVRDGASGRSLARLPLGRWIEARHGAPYWTVHRQDLHDALRQTALTRREIQIVEWFSLAGAVETATGVIARAEDGRERAGLALVGADGIGSAVRRLLHPALTLAAAGKTATRTVIGAPRISPPLGLEDVGVWLTPGLHIVHYPVAGGRDLAVVAIIDEGWSAEGWNTPVAADRLMAKLQPLTLPLRAALGKAADWHMWALALPLELPFWSRGRLTLLGDAAHPTLPFLAQGGALAIEDAVVLAQCLADRSSDVAEAFRRYEALRRARAARVQRASSRNGRIYHLDGPARLARDLALKALPGPQLMAGLDWLYGWRPTVDGQG